MVTVKDNKNCLKSDYKKPKIARKDITVYKIFYKQKHFDGFFSIGIDYFGPYSDYNFGDINDKIIKPEKGEYCILNPICWIGRLFGDSDCLNCFGKTKFNNGKYEIRAGWIHSSETKIDISKVKLPHKIDIKTVVQFECIIPKGTKYYYQPAGRDSHYDDYKVGSYASKELKIVAQINEIPKREPVKIYPAEIIKKIDTVSENCSNEINNKLN